MDPELIDVMVRVSPNEMEGINGLWRIAIDSQEKKVGESVTKLLLQLHTDVDFEVQDQLTTFEDYFIDSCFNIIRTQLEAIEARTPEEREEVQKSFEAIPDITSLKI